MTEYDYDYQGLLDGWSWPLFWLGAVVAAAILASIVTGLGWMRASWPGKTQTDKVTGVTTYGVGWWFVRILIAFEILPVVALVVSVFGPAMAWVAAHWAIIPIIGFCGVGIVFLTMWMRRQPDEPEAPPWQPQAPARSVQYGVTNGQPPAAAYLPQQPTQLWALPEDQRHGGLG